MYNRYKPKGISLISFPITSKNKHNTQNHPAINLGVCTPFQLLSYADIETSGSFCVLGNPARGISIAQALIRRSKKPFLLIGTSNDKNSALSALNPQWTFEHAQKNLPSGNGAILLSKPNSSYLEMCEYFEEWCNNYFIILHLGGGLQIGPEILNLLNSTQQCLIFCDSIPQGLRNSENRTITAKEFISQMSYLLVFSAGIATKDLIEILPTYQYENVSNTMSFNSYTSRSVLNPFHSHRGSGGSVGQTRTMEFKKSLFEMDELQSLFSSGVALCYNAKNNSVYLSQFI